MNNSLPPTTSALPADAVPAGLTRLGHYELLDCIGRGGMGLVYRARDTRLDRQVAIKCLRTELFEAHYVERFKREALLLAKLNHPNIVQIYDFIEAPDQLALVMELVEGQNLQLHLREHIVPFSQRMRWLAEIAQGLAVAHDAGIIHRDLKAENILINQRKVAKITDLGIAKSQDFNATLTDHIAGSYCSMSPEQAMGEAIDFKSDLFSFGILAYQLLCGAHPFGDTNNKLQLMQRIISHPPAAPSNHNPDLPSEINDLLGQLLSKDPAKRPDNTHWVATQLETLSHLQPANDFASDDTQVLIAGGSAANQSHVKNTGIASAVRTQDHPTFETRFVAINTAQKKSRWLPIKNYLLENKISVGFGLFSVLILAAVVIWQLQPKPPKYIAVIPPKLTSEGMQESQQELVKGAVYDAIQQSVIQLDGYYLIPLSEIKEVNGDNETVRRATAADELITSTIQCKVDVCTITLARLTSEGEQKNSRLRVTETKTIDTLAENYLSAAEIIQKSVGLIYATKINQALKGFDEHTYATFLRINDAYRKNGATDSLLHDLDKLTEPTTSLIAIKTLYREISLDLYHQTRDNKYLGKLEKVIGENDDENLDQLYNLYFLKIIQEDKKSSQLIESKIENLDSNASSLIELKAYKAMLNKEYIEASQLYLQSLQLKTTARTLFFAANAFWYQGKTSTAKEYLEKALSLSPKHHEANSLKGLIALTAGDVNLAIKSFEVVSHQNQNDIHNLNNLGLSYLLNRNYDLAIKTLAKAEKASPKNTTIVLNSADAENLAGNIETSKKMYHKIISLSKAEPSKTSLTLRNLAQAHAQLGQFGEAFETLKALEKVDPQNIETTYTAALIYSLADSEKAAVYYTKKSIADGMNPIWFRLSWFDSLCKNEEFILLMNQHKASERCPAH